MTFDLDLWPTDLKINRDHLLTKDYLPTKFEASGAKRYWVISCTRLRATNIPTYIPTYRPTGAKQYAPPFSKGGINICMIYICLACNRQWHDTTIQIAISYVIHVINWQDFTSILHFSTQNQDYSFVTLNMTSNFNYVQKYTCFKKMDKCIACRPHNDIHMELCKYFDIPWTITKHKYNNTTFFTHFNNIVYRNANQIYKYTLTTLITHLLWSQTYISIIQNTNHNLFSLCHVLRTYKQTSSNSPTAKYTISTSDLTRSWTEFIPFKTM